MKWNNFEKNVGQIVRIVRIIRINVLNVIIHILYEIFNALTKSKLYEISFE